MAIISKVETAFKSIYEEDKSELNSLIKQQRVECSRQWAGAGAGAGAWAGEWGSREAASQFPVPQSAKRHPHALFPLSRLSLFVSLP